MTETEKEHLKKIYTAYYSQIDFTKDHYTFGKFECIDVIEELSKQNNLQGIEGFLYGNILKYLWRYKHKNGVEDLQKARWYLDRLISNTENDYKPVGEKEK